MVTTLNIRLNKYKTSFFLLVSLLKQWNIIILIITIINDELKMLTIIDYC